MWKTCLIYAYVQVLLCSLVFGLHDTNFASSKDIKVGCSEKVWCDDISLILDKHQLARDKKSPLSLHYHEKHDGMFSSKKKRQVEGDNMGNDEGYDDDESEDDEDTYVESSQDEEPKQELSTSNNESSVIVENPAKAVLFAMPSTPSQPILNRQVSKLVVTAIAGKAFRYRHLLLTDIYSYILPTDLFIDAEDGTNLTYNMRNADNTKLDINSWVQFAPKDREIYGLPLQSHVSHWNFIVEACDSEGHSASVQFDLDVQKDKYNQVLNHKFILELKLIYSYTNDLDWQIRALEGIVNAFEDDNMEHVNVLNASRKGDIYEFVWANDTIPMDLSCPIEKIMVLWKVMSYDSGGPSDRMVNVMRPELELLAVWWEGLGACAMLPASATENDPHELSPRQKYSPIKILDTFNATEGYLFVHKIPEKRLYSHEDKKIRYMNISLRFSNLSEVPPEHWLQFDAENYELYGLPGTEDVGNATYELVIENSEEMKANHSFAVNVMRADPLMVFVEFHLKMNYSYPDLANIPRTKRRFLEQLAVFLGQNHTDNIRITSITDNPTTVVWYNTSLPTEFCPVSEIQDLQSTIIGNNVNKNEDDYFFDRNFNISSITVVPLGLCAKSNPEDLEIVLYDEASAESNSGDLNYFAHSWSFASADALVTFIIPTVIIFTILMIVAVGSSILYKQTITRTPDSNYPRIRIV